MEQVKKSLQRQTLPTIPLEPKKLGIWNGFLILLFGVALGASLGLTSRAKAEQGKTIYEGLTEQDRSELNELLKGIE